MDDITKHIGRSMQFYLDDILFGGVFVGIGERKDTGTQGFLFDCILEAGQSILSCLLVHPSQIRLVDPNLQDIFDKYNFPRYDDFVIYCSRNQIKIVTAEPVMC